MNAPHLNPERWDALLEGRLEPAEAEAVTAHLEAGCETCEAFLVGREAVDVLDGLVDDALLGLPEAQRSETAATAARQPQAAPQPGFEPGIESAARPASPAGRHMRRLVGWGAAGAAALALLLVAVLVPGGGKETGGPAFREKGAEAPVQVELRALVRSEGRLAPLTDAPVEPGAVLVFQLVAPEPVCVHLVEAWGARLEALTDAPLCVSGGTTVLSLNDRPLGLPLGAAGEHVVWAVPAQPGAGPSGAVEALSSSAGARGAASVSVEVGGGPATPTR